MVRLRMDPRARARFDASDVVQEVFVEAVQRCEGYLESPSMGFYPWLRFIAVEKLLQFHRRHLEMKRRDARKEVVHARDLSSFSLALAEELVSSGTSPSEAARRKELKAMLLEILDGMDPLDREILSLRHFEDLTNVETAEVLGIRPNSASVRHFRALGKLREVLEKVPELKEWGLGR